MVYYIFFLTGILKGLNKLKVSPLNSLSDEYVSIIIPFRNESENILKSLQCLETQSYPKDKFEVIYVDDFSEDDSFSKINLSGKSENVKVLSVPERYSPNAHKKRAIRYGIENSKGEIIVTTDADCIQNKDWLLNLLSYFDKNTAFVSGPVEFMNDDKLFSKIQKIEFSGLVLAGAGLIGNNRPTICNAANIAYRKNIYEMVGGFKDQLNLSSGDDELLMQKIAKETNYQIRFCINREAVVKTAPNKSLKEFYQQRKRWASKGLFYADKLLILKLVFIFLFYLGLFIQFILAVFNNHIFILSFTISLMSKVILERKIMLKGSKILFSNEVLSGFWLTELFHIPYIIIAGISGIFGNFVWKERKISR